jgi:hypothetical protein
LFYLCNVLTEHKNIYFLLPGDELKYYDYDFFVEDLKKLSLERLGLFSFTYKNGRPYNTGREIVDDFKVADIF